MTQRLERMEAALADALGRRAAEQSEPISSERSAELGIDLSERLGRAALAEAIAELPEREKLAVLLYYYEELTRSEIADVLAISTQAVSRMLVDSTAFLRKWLEHKAADDLAGLSGAAALRVRRRGQHRAEARPRAGLPPQGHPQVNQKFSTLATTLPSTIVMWYVACRVRSNTDPIPTSRCWVRMVCSPSKSGAKL